MPGDWGRGYSEKMLFQEEVISLLSDTLGTAPQISMVETTEIKGNTSGIIINTIPFIFYLASKIIESRQLRMGAGGKWKAWSGMGLAGNTPPWPLPWWAPAPRDEPRWSPLPQGPLHSQSLLRASWEEQRVTAEQLQTEQPLRGHFTLPVPDYSLSNEKVFILFFKRKHVIMPHTESEKDLVQNSCLLETRTATAC